MLFGKTPIALLSFTNIMEIKRVSFQETLQLKNIFIAVRLGFYGQGKGIVLIKLKEGIRITFPPDIFCRETLFIFPDNPDMFVQEVRIRQDLPLESDKTYIESYLERSHIEYGWNEKQKAYFCIIRDIKKNMLVSENLQFVLFIGENGKLEDIKFSPIMTGL